MLMVADPAAWSSDPQSGYARIGIPIGAGTTRAVLSIDWDSPDQEPVPVDVQCAALAGVPVVRHLPGHIAVDCALRAPQGVLSTIVLPRAPTRMTARCFGPTQGLIGWQVMLPAWVAHPRPVRQTFSPLDLAAIRAQLQAGEIDQVLDELTFVWTETSESERSEATILLFEYLAEHPLKRAVVLGAMMASLCNFQAPK